MSSRRDTIPFDPRHFEKLRAQGETASTDAVFRDIYRRNHWAGPESRSGLGAGQDQTAVNEEIATGDWRPLDLELDPFGFPAFELLNEGCTEGGGLFADKSLGLWRTADLARLPFLLT